MKGRVSPRGLVILTLAVLFFAWLAFVRFWPDPAVAEAVGPVGISFGQAQAPVTVVAFVSPVCSHCQAFEAESAPVLYRAAAAGSLHYVVYPVRTGSASYEDVTALLCASKQLAFSAFLTLGLEQRDRVATDVAREVGLDTAHFSGCLSRPDMQAQAQAIGAWAQDLNVRATPTFYVRDTPQAPYRKLEGDKGARYWETLAQL